MRKLTPTHKIRVSLNTHSILRTANLSRTAHAAHCSRARKALCSLHHSTQRTTHTTHPKHNTLHSTLHSTRTHSKKRARLSSNTRIHLALCVPLIFHPGTLLHTVRASNQKLALRESCSNASLCCTGASVGVRARTRSAPNDADAGFRGLRPPLIVVRAAALRDRGLPGEVAA